MQTHTSTARPMARQRARTIVCWALQLVLAFLFFGGGSAKLGGAPEMVDMFTAIGAGQWLRFAVGGLEVAGAVGLLIPRLAGLAALGLACVLVGAIATNLLILAADSRVALAMLLTSAAIVWLRRGDIARIVARYRRSAVQVAER